MKTNIIHEKYIPFLVNFLLDNVGIKEMKKWNREKWIECFESFYEQVTQERFEIEKLTNTN